LETIRPETIPKLGLSAAVKVYMLLNDHKQNFCHGPNAQKGRKNIIMAQ
jgi:hypothetical protein